MNGYHVDLILRDIKRVEQIIKDTEQGIVTANYQTGHPHGYISAMYRGELAISKIQYAKNESLCELKNQAEIYPGALKKSLINFFIFEAEFSLMFVKANAGAEDKYYIAGHVFRIISCLNQVLFACNNAYCINEKKAIKLLETFEYKPKKYAERVNHIFEVLGLSLFECYDMTEKLYKEVKKIATEINNFLNEGGIQMKENKYDDNIFFQKYSQMSRSQQGLAGAGEWETLRKLLPDFKDKRVLDLGCGYGWHCIYAMEHGASSVVGVDISHKMLEVAKEKTHFPQVEYKCCAIEDVEFPEESFDVILSSLAFHYVADYEILVKKIYRILKSGGKLVFTVEHPVFTAYGTQDWYYNEKGEILHFPVDNYYYEGKRTAVFLGEKVTKFHRTLTTYLNTLLSNGFIINHIVEPQPPENMMDIPGMQDEMRRPMMLIVSANKKVDR